MRQETGAEVEVVDGSAGELTVAVDGKIVARKQGDDLPDPATVVEAVKREMPVGSRR